MKSVILRLMPRVYRFSIIKSNDPVTKMRRVYRAPDAFRALYLGWCRFGSFFAARSDVCQVDPFGFSWFVAVSLRLPPIMKVGFPWILSSVSSLINGLRGLEQEQIFSALSVPLLAPEWWWGGGWWPAEQQDCSWGELN